MIFYVYFLGLYTYRILIYSGYMVENYKFKNFIKENHSSLDSGLGSQDQNLRDKKAKQLFRVLSQHVWENRGTFQNIDLQLCSFPARMGESLVGFLKYCTVLSRNV